MPGSDVVGPSGVLIHISIYLPSTCRGWEFEPTRPSIVLSIPWRMTCTSPPKLAAALFAGATFAFACAVLPEQARAAAPQQHTQAPGWYRMMLGDFEITALLDGTHPFPIDEVMTHATREQLSALLAQSDVVRPVEGSINAFLVNTGQRLVLVDTGAGALYGDCCGRLVMNLRAAGYQPEQVDDILLTHLHRDHVGGVAAGHAMAFPNATIHVSRVDLDYWTSRANQKAAPPSCPRCSMGQSIRSRRTWRLIEYEPLTQRAPSCQGSAHFRARVTRRATRPTLSKAMAGPCWPGVTSCMSPPSSFRGRTCA